MQDIHPGWLVDNEDQAQLHRLGHESHALVTMLRQYVINESLEHLNEIHKNPASAGSETLWMGNDDALTFGGQHAKGLCVHGSACFPPNVRMAGDLDMTVNMGEGYNVQDQRNAFDTLMFAVATMIKNTHMIKADLSLPSHSKGIQQLKEDKAIAMAYFRTHIATGDIEKIKNKLRERFDFTQGDLAVLDRLNAATIASIVKQRQEEAERAGGTYVPTLEEAAGRGLTIVTSIGLFAKDRLNIFSPLSMGAKKDLFKERTSSPLNTLMFSYPLEETADKFFAVFASPNRAMVDEPHAKDLVDLYLHTRGFPKPCRSWADIVVPSREMLVDTVRILWPAHPAFHQMELYFKKTDPQISKNIKQVTKGLLKLKEHGIITAQTFGEEITEANAESYAEKLLTHAWEIAKECYGIQRGGSNHHPSYRLEPPEAVKSYWDACRAIPESVRKPLASDLATTRAEDIQADLKEKIGRLLGGKYDTDRDRENIKSSGAMNAYVNADRSRQWIGFKK